MLIEKASRISLELIIAFNSSYIPTPIQIRCKLFDRISNPSNSLWHIGRNALD